MKHVMLIAHLDKSSLTYDAWKKIFDADKEAQSKFWKGTLVGKVDDKTAIITTEIIDQPAMMAFMAANGPRFESLKIEHEVYGLSPIQP